MPKIIVEEAEVEEEIEVVVEEEETEAVVAVRTCHIKSKGHNKMINKMQIGGILAIKSNGNQNISHNEDGLIIQTIKSRITDNNSNQSKTSNRILPCNSFLRVRASNSNSTFPNNKISISAKMKPQIMELRDNIGRMRMKILQTLRTLGQEVADAFMKSLSTTRPLLLATMIQ